MNKMNLILSLGLLVSAVAFAEPGRSLPSGEDDPLYIKKIYTSPQGELQFLQNRKGHSAFFRDTDGDLITIDRIEGMHACTEWFDSDKSGEMPPNCEFIFPSTLKPVTYRVNSNELTESSVFQTVRGVLRGQGRNVAL